jgi:hypothetical protein
MRDGVMRLGDGAEVELTLANGKSYRGKLGSVGDHSVIVSELSGKEFYDALIKLEGHLDARGPRPRPIAVAPLTRTGTSDAPLRARVAPVRSSW